MYASSSNLSTSRRSAPSSSSALPSWLFDVEEFDEEDTGETLLDGSSAGGILRMLVWVMKLPVLLLMCRSSVQAAELMPLPTSTLASDLYGPVAVVGLFVLILWAGRVRDTTWVLIIWSGGAAFTHLIARVTVHKSTLMAHLAILGYGVAPLAPVALVIVVVDPTNWVKIILQVTGVVWGGAATHLSQRVVFLPPKTSSSSSSLSTGVGAGAGTGGGATGAQQLRGHSTSHLPLLFFPAVLTLCYISSFL